VRDVLDDVLIDLHVVGAADDGAELEAELGLGGRHLVVMLLDAQPHVVHHLEHLGADVALAVDRRHREVAALDRRAVAGVAVGVFLVADIGAFIAVDLVHRPVHAGLVADVVEDEELRLGPEIGRVADAGGDEVGLGLLGHRARVAAIGLSGQRLVAVAEDDERGLRREGIEHRGLAVGHEQHVALVDHLPAGDRGAVEHHAARQEVLGDGADVVRQMLPFAARIGEAEIDELDVVLLDHRHDFLNVGHSLSRR